MPTVKDSALYLEKYKDIITNQPNVPLKWLSKKDQPKVSVKHPKKERPTKQPRQARQANIFPSVQAAQHTSLNFPTWHKVQVLM